MVVVFFFNLFHQSLSLIDVFRTFAFNVITDILVLKSVTLFFLFCHFPFLSVFIFCFLFPDFL